MNTNLRMLILLVVTLSACQNREWTSPFDPSCPKEIWTPTNFKAVQEGATIKLTWNQPINQISGFKITKSVDGGTNTSLPDLANGVNQFVDNSLIGGKKHSYNLTAFAGSNLSNTVSVQITPLFASSISATTLTTVKAFAATLSTTISTDGGAPVTARGICWSTSQNPTLSGNKTNDGMGAGSFTSSLAGLSTSTTYYARSYATNSVGTVYGTQVNFTTNYGEVTDIDGNVYQTVKIGNQIWMAENLRTTKYNDGAAIQNVTNYTTWLTLKEGSYCWYNNDATSYKYTYGALYNFYAVITNKLAPTGWYVPTDADWTTLTNYLGGLNVAGGKLKETGLSHWLSQNVGATNDFNFTALPGGYRDVSDKDIGHIGEFWSSTEFPYWFAALYRVLASDISSVYIGNPAAKTDGFSIRCIQGNLPTPVLLTLPISNFTTTTATLGGNVTSDGGLSITTRGVCYNTSPHPDLSNTKTNDGSTTGSFISNLSGLSSGTTYYARAYAGNSGITAYGNEISFTTAYTPDQTVADSDGNLYHVVKIGLQLWMVENLKTTKFRNGDAIPYWTKTGPAGYCWYNDDIANKVVYGAIYNFYIATGANSICPSGWHIPNDGEWTTLINFLGGENVAGGKIKETGTIHWTSPNTGATNEAGFTALPGGSRDCGNAFGGIGTSGGWTSSSQAIGGWTTGYHVESSNSKLNYGKGYDCNASYVRCIKD